MIPPVRPDNYKPKRLPRRPGYQAGPYYECECCFRDFYETDRATAREDRVVLCPDCRKPLED